VPRDAGVARGECMARPADKLPDPPPSLDAKLASELNSQTEAALHKQRRELMEALERALAHIPRPLRGAVRRVVGL
jgi:hypothetical protein